MSDEHKVPKWGDDPETIPQVRRDELLSLHEEQTLWMRDTGPDRDYSQSPFAAARGPGWDLSPLDALSLRGVEAKSLTGAEVYFLVETFRDRFGNLDDPHLEVARLVEAHLEGANLTAAHLERTDLRAAYLEGARLTRAYLEGANLSEVHLEGATLRAAHLEGANLGMAHLVSANLQGAFFSGATDLTDATIFDVKLGMPSVADVRWQNVNLAVISYPEKPVLGDERKAREAEKKPLNLPKGTSRSTRQLGQMFRDKAILDGWREAARAYRQLASVMRDQGMSDEADRFAYRGNVCQRELYRVQGKRLRQFGSWLLDLISGYGYKPLRSVAAYVLIISLFAGLYLLNAQFAAPHLSWDEALVLSISSFHGRGFFSSGISLGDTLARLAAGEAIVGLLIVITFIATFTQRFFAR